MFEQQPIAPHVSFSSKNTYTACGERSRLETVFKVPTQPGWWNVGGTAAHTLTELHDRRIFDADVEIPTFEIAFEMELEAVLEKGRKSNPDLTEADLKGAKKGVEGKDFWLRNGPKYVKNYLDWRDKVPWDIALIEGEIPAIELPLEFQLLDGTPFVAYIDRVYQMRADSSLVVVDLKSGANKPETADQVVDYATGLRFQFGLDVPWGTFVDLRSGQHSALVPTRRGDIEKMTYVYGGYDDLRKAGMFLPNRRKDCAWCPVRDYCYAAGGALSNEVPRPWEMEPIVVRAKYDPNMTTEEGSA